MVHEIGFPFATVFAAILTGVETLGAVCVILGVLTRIWSLMMAVDMVVAILAVVLPRGQAPELEGMLLAGSLALSPRGRAVIDRVTLKKGDFSPQLKAGCAADRLPHFPG
jgi:uncharacterized membrane protein YphA (DoxX/SURF4 family)